MSRKVKSIKNETVDFDLFDIKNQIGKSPKSTDVLMRESYIDIKRRRASRKDIEQLQAEQEKNKAMVRKRMKEQQRNGNDVKKNIDEKSTEIKLDENVDEVSVVKEEKVENTSKPKPKRIIKTKTK